MRPNGRRKQSGQSAILIALLIVFMVGMVGLAVDVGNAFGQQRRTQNITNSGALAGMGSILAGSTNNMIWSDVQRAMVGNRAGQQPEFSYRVDYVMDDETVQRLGEWNGSIATVQQGSSLPPKNLVRVQVTMTEQVGTYFAGVLGQDELTVNANGVACLGDYGYGVYPLGVPQTLRPPVKNSQGKILTAGHNIFRANGTELSPDDPSFGKWEQMQGMTIRIPFTNNASGSDFTSGVHISWLNWGGDTQTVDGVQYTQLSGYNGTSQLKAAWTYPGTLQNGFLEAKSSDLQKPNTKPMGKLQRGDWVAGNPGVRAALKAEFDVMKNNGTEVMLPMYDAVGSGNGSQAAYHMVNMGIFKIVNSAFTGNPKYIDLAYLGEAATAPEACGSEASVPGTPSDKRFNISGDADATRVWRTWTSNNVTSDIVIVMDTSASMYFDWSDRLPWEPGYQAPRFNDAKRVVSDFVRGYDVSATGDPDARIAFVTFGGTTPGNCDLGRYTGSSSGCSEGKKSPSGFDPAVVQTNWATACSAAVITNDCNGPDNKWSPIQTKANAITPEGSTPGPIAFEEIETLLMDKRMPAAGKTYKQVVIFATDGVFNVCGNSVGQASCPYGQMVPKDGSGGSNSMYYYNNSGYNAVSGRPIWQAQQVAARLRQGDVRVFVVALTPTCLESSTTCFDPSGLKDMSSGDGYYYQADAADALAEIYSTIRQKVNQDTCMPQEVKQPAANATVVLTRPDNPTWSMSTTSNSAGEFAFTNLLSGEYVVRVDPALSLTSPEDGHTRAYSRLRNNLSLSEEDQASVYINPQYPDGSTVYSEVLLSLPLTDDGAPNSGCTMPTP